MERDTSKAAEDLAEQGPGPEPRNDASPPPEQKEPVMGQAIAITPGRIVYYVLNTLDVRPAIVTSVKDEKVNLRVFPEPGDFIPGWDPRSCAAFIKDARIGTLPGCWHWPIRS